MIVRVKKKSGDFEDFDVDKLKKSLSASGASKKQVETIIQDIMPKILVGITTAKIFNLAFSKLRKISGHYARNYSLKKAIFELGPSGFYFEKFCGEILRAQGFKTTLDQIRKGCCVKHEVDIIGKRPDKNIFVECKFHNTPSKKNDVKTALYIHARSMDLLKNAANDFEEYWIMSNTTFSKDAIAYAQCVGLKLVGINCSDNHDMQTIVNKYNIHPITSLQSLKLKDCQKLMEKNIVTTAQLAKKKQILFQLGFPHDVISNVLLEIKDMKSMKEKYFV